jgi:stage V sporulation protein AF
MVKLSESSSENAAALARIIGLERNFDIVNKKINVGGRAAEFFMIDGFTKDEIME